VDLVISLHELLVHVVGQELMNPWTLTICIHTHRLSVFLGQVALHTRSAGFEVAVLAFYALAVGQVVGITADGANV